MDSMETTQRLKSQGSGQAPSEEALRAPSLAVLSPPPPSPHSRESPAPLCLCDENRKLYAGRQASGHTAPATRRRRGACTVPGAPLTHKASSEQDPPSGQPEGTEEAGPSGWNPQAISPTAKATKHQWARWAHCQRELFTAWRAVRTGTPPAGKAGTEQASSTWGHQAAREELGLEPRRPCSGWRRWP